MPPIKIISWNCASIASIEAFINHQHGSMGKWLESLDADIITFQETKMTPRQQKDHQAPFFFPKGWSSYWGINKDKPWYCGIACYVKDFSPFAPPLAVYTDAGLFREEEEEGLADEGRLLVLDFGSFVLFSVYVPNCGGKDRPRLAFKVKFVEALFRHMEEFRTMGRSVILTGDLNLIAHPKLDQHPNINQDEWSIEEAAWFKKVLIPYADSFRHLHPTEAKYSFWAQIKDARGYDHGLRIDYGLISRDLLPCLREADIIDLLKSTRASDHAAVTLMLDLEPPTTEYRKAHQQKQPGCVMEKVSGNVVLKHIAPDKAQKSLMSFYGKKKSDDAVAVEGVKKEQQNGGGSGEAEEKKPEEKDKEGERIPKKAKHSADGNGGNVSTSSVGSQLSSSSSAAATTSNDLPYLTNNKREKKENVLSPGSSGSSSSSSKKKLQSQSSTSKKSSSNNKKATKGGGSISGRGGGLLKYFGGKQ